MNEKIIEKGLSVWLNASIREGVIFAEDDELVQLLHAYNNSIWDKPLLLIKDVYTQDQKVHDRICYNYNNGRTNCDNSTRYMFVCEDNRLNEDNFTAKIESR